MAICVNLSLPAPQLPPIFIALPSFNFVASFGQVGVTCCKVTLPAFSLPISIPSPGSAFAIVIKAINTAILAAWPTLSKNIPTCPMNGKTL